MKLIRTVGRVAVLMMSMGLLTACGAVRPAATPAPVSDGSHPLAIITLEDGRTIQVELYPEKAPNTVNNFIYLANTRHLYDGTVFHRVIENFMIQGGSPDGTGSGGPGHQISGEFAANGFAQNDLKHIPGVISMARAKSYDSAGSQFFICTAASAHLDGQYAAFGMTVSGLDAAEEISRADTDMYDRPLKEIKVKTIRVELNGYEAQLPVTSPQVK